VLAGESDEPHPIFGERISVRVAGERLVISGELERDQDRDALLQQARARIGHGIRELDAARLRVAHGHERPGLLDQTLVAAFPDRETADLARKLDAVSAASLRKGDPTLGQGGSSGPAAPHAACR